MWSDDSKDYHRIDWYSQDVNAKWHSPAVRTFGLQDTYNILVDPTPVYVTHLRHEVASLRDPPGVRTLSDAARPPLKVGSAAMLNGDYVGSITHLDNSTGTMMAILNTGQVVPLQSLSPPIYYHIDRDEDENP